MIHEMSLIATPQGIDVCYSSKPMFLLNFKFNHIANAWK